MEIQHYGANCFRLSTKKASVIIDDNLEELGGKKQIKKGDIALFTAAHGNVGEDVTLTVDHPGEFEVSTVSIIGVSARSHMDEEGKKSATIFKVVTEDIRILVAGHIHPDLTEEQLEQIGVIDLMIVPVGGNGYTLDGIGAQKVIKKVEPRIVIPSHYSGGKAKLSYPVPQASLEDAIKQLGMDVAETTDKLKLKSSDIPENSQLFVVEAS